jgi:pyridoxamine 5'-phosphate oxidase
MVDRGWPTERVESRRIDSVNPLPSFADLRQDYRVGELVEDNVDPDPFAQFRRWFNEAFAARLPGGDEPHAMTLATVLDGQPMTRIVLLKGLDDTGFVWFTNYGSQKGRALAFEPRAALNFYWGTLERQVNVIGVVEKVTSEESNAYFLSRPVGSRIGAIASAQSSVISGRSVLEDAAAALAERPEHELLRPPHWGGFRLRPVSIEFWQGRPSRLHDRLRYRRESLAETDWTIERLAP